MTGPIVPGNAFTERTGIIQVELAVNQARCIWRETPLRDVGIDGQIEHVDVDGYVTGRMIAVQVKSGPSYFEGETESLVRFYPSPEHRHYWSVFPLPVILILHHPGRGLTCWGDAQSQLRQGEKAVRVPKSQIFDSDGVLKALGMHAPLPSGPARIEELARLMLDTRCPDAGFEMSFFDLFFQGLTDARKSVYFGMDLASEIADVKAALPGRLGVVGVGQDAVEFIDAYVTFLVTHNLALVDHDAWKKMDQQYELIGHFISPLTRRGLDLVDYVSGLDALLGVGAGYSRVVQDRSVKMVLTGIDERVEHIERFKASFDELAARAPAKGEN